MVIMVFDNNDGWLWCNNVLIIIGNNKIITHIYEQ